MLSEVETKPRPNELITPIPATDPTDDVPTNAVLYRLYKRRWVGVFAMVNKQPFFCLGYMLTT